MFEYEEIIALAMSLFVMAFVIIRRSELGRITGCRWLLGGFCSLFTALLLTVVEGWLPLGGFTNLLEHLAYALSGGLVAYWVWRHLPREEAGA